MNRSHGNALKNHIFTAIQYSFIFHSMYIFYTAQMHVYFLLHLHKMFLNIYLISVKRSYFSQMNCTYSKHERKKFAIVFLFSSLIFCSREKSLDPFSAAVPWSARRLTESHKDTRCLPKRQRCYQSRKAMFFYIFVHARNIITSEHRSGLCITEPMYFFIKDHKCGALVFSLL